MRVWAQGVTWEQRWRERKHEQALGEKRETKKDGRGKENQRNAIERRGVGNQRLQLRWIVGVALRGPLLAFVL